MAEQSAAPAQNDYSRRVAEVFNSRRDEILNLWIKDRLESDDFRDELISKKELRHQSRQLLELLVRGIEESGGGDFDDAAFDELRRFLNEISHQRAVKGYTPMEHATYVSALRNTVRPM